MDGSPVEKFENPPTSERVFVCYRRETTKDIARRLWDHLENHFGKGTVFIDEGNIPVGQPFKAHIRSVLDHCKVMVVIIGKQWAASGLQREDDVLRWELETAEQLGLAILPVLVHNAALPGQLDLPDHLKWVLGLEIPLLSSGPDFENHLNRLIQGIERVIGAPAPPPNLRTAPKLGELLVLGIAALLLVALGLIIAHSRGTSPTPAPPRSSSVAGQGGSVPLTSEPALVRPSVPSSLSTGTGQNPAQSTPRGPSKGPYPGVGEPRSPNREPRNP